eukprot:326532-Heterocapsa_arctica.AAC.1
MTSQFSVSKKPESHTPVLRTKRNTPLSSPLALLLMTNTMESEFATTNQLRGTVTITYKLIAI